jgi:hypothetical protein
VVQQARLGVRFLEWIPAFWSNDQPDSGIRRLRNEISMKVAARAG